MGRAGKRKKRGRSGQRGRRPFYALGFLLLVAVVAVFTLSRGPRRLEIPVPPNLESFDPQVRAYLNKYIERARTAPGEAWAQSALGLVYAANKVWPEARQCFANAARLDPAEPLARHYQAIASAELGEIESAFANFGQVTREFPGFAPARQRYGAGLLSRGRLAEAGDQFQRIVDLAPQAPEGHTGLGEFKFRSGDYAAAAQHLEKALELAPRRRKTRYLLGRTYLKLGRDVEARKHLSGGVNTETKFMPDAWSREKRNHGMILADQIDRALDHLDAGQAEQGAKILEEALSWHPKNVDVSNNLGIMYLQLGRPNEALEMLQEAVQHDESRFETYINLAAVHMGLNDLAEALSAADRAVQLAPQVAQAQLTRARILAKLRQTGEALEAYRLAVQYDAENLAIRAELAPLCARTGRFSEAKEHYRAIVRGDPGNFGATVRLCHACIQLGDYNEAAEVLEAARQLQPGHDDLDRLAEMLDAGMNR